MHLAPATRAYLALAIVRHIFGGAGWVTISVKRVYAWMSLAVLMAGSLGCTMTQKVASGAAVGGVTGFAVGGPIGAGVGAVGGAIAVPVAMSD